MRVIHAVRELNGSRAEPIRLIALHTEPELHATWALSADESHSLGSPTFVDPVDGGRKGRYLDYGALGSARSHRPGPTRPGSAGGSWPSTWSSPSSATGSG